MYYIFKIGLFFEAIELFVCNDGCYGLTPVYETSLFFYDSKCIFV